MHGSNRGKSYGYNYEKRFNSYGTSDNNTEIDGTAVRKTQTRYDVYRENEILRQKKKNKVNSKLKLSIFARLAVFFVCAMILMYRFAAITELNYKIGSMNRKIENLRNENARMAIDIEKSADLNYVEEIAVTKLGMQRPLKNQIVYVNIEKKDITSYRK